jgi:cardiolipin synthase
MAVFTFPNILTLMRILLMPCFAFTLIYGYNKSSLFIFFISAMTDLFDGFLARKRHEATKIGSILDPLADKFLLITSFVIMSHKEWIPTWLTILVLSTHIIIATGWLLFSLISGVSSVKPSFLGKAAVFSQFTLVGFILLIVNFHREDSLPESFFIIVALLTALSGVHYLYRGLIVNNKNENSHTNGL